MKAYKRITSVIMASTEIVECVEFDVLPTLESVTYESGEIETDDLLLTKDAVIEAASHIILSGYGIQSGRKVWQAGDCVINQIKKALKKEVLK